MFTFVCKHCKQEKEYTEFKFMNHGTTVWGCKDCFRIYMRDYNSKPEVKQKKLENQRKIRSQEGYSEHRKFLNIKAKYNLTEEEYNKILNNQEGRCAICKKLPEECSGKNTLYVDHNHTTNEVRELLCFNCNAVLGLVYEDKEILLKIIDYLLKHNSESITK